MSGLLHTNFETVWQLWRLLVLLCGRIYNFEGKSIKSQISLILKYRLVERQGQNIDLSRLIEF